MKHLPKYFLLLLSIPVLGLVKMYFLQDTLTIDKEDEENYRQLLTYHICIYAFLIMAIIFKVIIEKNGCN